MAFYTNAEMADMHFMYGRANGNALEARRLYAQNFPNREIPSNRIFAKLHQRLRDTGMFGKNAGDSGRPRSISTPEVEEEILAIVQENPGTSIRRIAAQIDISPRLIWRTLKEQLLYPYHIQRVQTLNPPDFRARLEFCRWILRKQARNVNLIANILFTDEAGFTRDGIFNFHNTHQWADENPHAIVESRHQQRFSLNVWLGILGDRLIGPVVLPDRLTGPAYQNFLMNTLPPLLEDVPLNLRAASWFMHDGAPPHFSLAVREYLNQMYQERWIGRGGPVAWPPRSPDLNPLDFFIWGYLKSLVYAEPINNLEQLENRIEEACVTIRIKPGVFERARDSFLRRCRVCIDMEGGHFQHLL